MKTQNLVKNNLARSANPFKSFCYFWLLPKVESPLTLNLNLPNKADLQNLRDNDEILDSSLRFLFAQNDNVREFLLKFLLLFVKAKSRIPLNPQDFNLPSQGRFAESKLFIF